MSSVSVLIHVLVLVICSCGAGATDTAYTPTMVSAPLSVSPTVVSAALTVIQPSSVLSTTALGSSAEATASPTAVEPWEDLPTSSIPTATPDTRPIEPSPSNHKLCYKKAYGRDQPVTTCIANSHGCYETERRRNRDGLNHKKMDCLKKSCRPIMSRLLVRRQCCNESLCNNLHEPERQSLFLPPPPTLPPIGVNRGWMYCYSPAHTTDWERCITTLGCYILYHSPIYTEEEVYIRPAEVEINRTCIDPSLQHLCYSSWKVDGSRAECCFHQDYCNVPLDYVRPTLTFEGDIPGDTGTTLSTDTGTTLSTPSREDATTERSGFDPLNYVTIGVVCLAVLLFTVIVTAGVAFYLHSSKKVQQQAPAVPRPIVRLPPPNPMESMTITQPIEDLH